MVKAIPDCKTARGQFTVATLLWILFSVSCFFGGRFSDRQIEQWTPNKNLVQLRMSADNSVTIKTDSKIPKILIDNMSACSITPLSPTTFKIQANELGRSIVTLVDESGVSKTYSVDVVD